MLIRALVALSLIAAAPAQASTLSCEGREIQTGGQGRSGAVEFSLEDFTASGIEGDDIISGGSLCGSSIEGANCVVSDHSMSLTPSLKIACSKNDETVPFASAYLVYSKQNANGRMVCESTNNKKVIEFANCK